MPASATMNALSNDMAHGQRRRSPTPAGLGYAVSLPSPARYQPGQLYHTSPSSTTRSSPPPGAPRGPATPAWYDAEVSVTLRVAESMGGAADSQPYVTVHIAVLEPSAAARGGAKPTDLSGRLAGANPSQPVSAQATTAQSMRGGFAGLQWFGLNQSRGVPNGGVGGKPPGGPGAGAGHSTPEGQYSTTIQAIQYGRPFRCPLEESLVLDLLPGPGSPPFIHHGSNGARPQCPAPVSSTRPEPPHLAASYRVL
eukprot:gene8591-34033_t